MVTIHEWTKSTFEAGKELEVDKLFRQAIKHNASDLHLQVGRPAVLRIRGSLHDLQMPAISESQMVELVFPMMDQRNLDIFHRDGGADLAKVVTYEGEEWSFRVNILTQMGRVGMVARKIERTILPFDKLNLPPIVEDLCKFDQGMILLAGVTGSGKTTTIASMLNWVNHNMNKHILTIEDPIEFVFQSDKCLINQREIGMDVLDFGVALKHAVREDPDVMLVGEMRDQETFETAVHAAATGHLVFATIHASGSPGTIRRILDLFPQEMHGAMRSAIVQNVKAIIAQKLVKTILKDPGRVPILEIMIFNPIIRKLLQEEEDHKLYQAMSAAREEGMQRFNDSLQYFIEKDTISRAAAFEVSPNIEELKMRLKGIDVRSAGVL